MRNKRTSIDFSKHIVEVSQSEGLLVHHLRIPNSYRNSIKFINTNGIMAVTGDFGNWIFCREFQPSAEGAVSDGYWCEKLGMASTQTYSNFSQKETQLAIQELLSTEEDLTEGETEYLNECLSAVEEGEFDYTRVAYRENVGRFEDAESVPFRKEINVWLSYIFDGFDEICRRMKEAKLPHHEPQ